MAKKSKSKSKSKSRPKSKSKTAAKTKIAPKAKAKKKRGGSAPKSRPRQRSSARGEAAARTAAAVTAAAAGPIDTITRIAAASPIARFPWPGRGVAPIGYTKGMAVVFARVLCKLRAGDAAAAEMAKANTGDAMQDVLAHYEQVFRGLGMNNDMSGPDTLRHLLTLMVGLGMRESSGKFCEGQDRHAPENQTAEKAEAGLFQTSFDARHASPLLPALITKFSANPPPAGFREIFREGCDPCTAADLENFGTGPGRDFQQLSKESPGFAAEFAAVNLRNACRHYGPIRNRAAKVMPDCDAMLRQVQNVVEASPEICAVLM
jgi:hypothetical protein